MGIASVFAVATLTTKNDLYEWIIASMVSEDIMIVVLDLAVNVHFYIPKLLNYFRIRNLPFKYVKTVEELKAVPVVHCVILTGSDLFVTDVHKHPRISALLDYAMKLPVNVPRIGICFGSQFLYAYAGGKLERLPRAICSTRNIQTELPVDHVQFCLHEVFADPVPADIEVLATARLGNKVRPCAFKYKRRDWYGFLFHPEANATSWKVLDAVMKRT